MLPRLLRFLSPPIECSRMALAWLRPNLMEVAVWCQGIVSLMMGSVTVRVISGHGSELNPLFINAFKYFRTLVVAVVVLRRASKDPLYIVASDAMFFGQQLIFCGDLTIIIGPDVLKGVAPELDNFCLLVFVLHAVVTVMFIWGAIMLSEERRALVPFTAVDCFRMAFAWLRSLRSKPEEVLEVIFGMQGIMTLMGFDPLRFTYHGYENNPQLANIIKTYVCIRSLAIIVMLVGVC
ncbi:hypothetical protein FOCC_FOCC004083, partial [Frankliniella occidentalis]